MKFSQSQFNILNEIAYDSFYHIKIIRNNIIIKSLLEHRCFDKMFWLILMLKVDNILISDIIKIT